MGRYEARPRSVWGRLRAKLARRAKAVFAGIAALVVGEVVLVLSDQGVLELIRDSMPVALQPLIPVAAASIVYVVTHAAPRNTDDTSGDEASED